jgi:phosphate transport system substrate-binding protein
MLQKLLLLAICTLLLSGQGTSARAEQEVLRIAGSTTVYPVTRRIARKFQQLHPDVEVIVTGGGSVQGISALLDRSADIANSSRFISQEELSRAFSSGTYPVPFRIADDCILPIVHNSNRVKNLELDQLRAIYAGEITNWREVGGSDLAIQVLSRDATSGTFGVWRDLVMQGDEVLQNQPLQESSDDMVRKVSREPGAIGYIGLGNLSATVKPLKVNGVMGSIYSVRNGSYLINRPLFMFTRGWPEGRALQFINYATDPDRGQMIIEEMGFVSLYSHRHNH